MRSRLFGCAATLLVACGSGVRVGNAGAQLADAAVPADPGAPVATDAGPQDGGFLACADLRFANAGAGDPCAGLRPVLGNPVIVRDDAGVICSQNAYPANGNGVVLFERFAEMAPGEREPALVFFDKAGKQNGIYAPPGPSLTGWGVVPLASGFGIITYFQAVDVLFGVDFFTDDAQRYASSGGAERAMPFAGGNVLTDAFVREDFGGSTGCDAGFGAVVLETYDSSGQRTGRIDHELGCYRGPPGPDRIVATTWEGNTAVLLRDQAWTVSWLHGPQLSPTLVNAPLTGFPAASETRVFAAPLLEGDVALALDGAWSFLLSPASATLESIPCWLADRPGTDLDIVLGGNAYAVLHPSDRCDQTLEIVSRQGLSCGYVPLGPPAVGCGGEFSSGPVVGRDGTIVRPPFAEDAGAGNPLCIQEYWPAALGRSGP
jgi:hypothetical protein